jgi:hypothetical protein
MNPYQTGNFRRLNITSKLEYINGVAALNVEGGSIIKKNAIFSQGVQVGDSSRTVAGNIKYDSTQNKFYGYTGSGWQLFGDGATSDINVGIIVASDITTVDLTATNIYGGVIVASDITTSDITAYNADLSIVSAGDIGCNNLTAANVTSVNYFEGDNMDIHRIVASDIVTSDLTAHNIYAVNHYIENHYVKNTYASDIYCQNIYGTDITTQSLTVTSDFTTHHLDVAGTITATDLSIDIIRDVVSMDTVEGASLNFRNATIGDLLRLQYAGDFNIMPNFSAATDAYDYGRLLYTRANPSDSFGGEFNIWSSYDFDPSDLKASDIIVGTITADTVVLGDGSTVTDGAIKYDSADNNFYGYNGTSWEQLNGGGDTGPSIVASDITTSDLTVGNIYGGTIVATDITTQSLTVTSDFTTHHLDVAGTITATDLSIDIIRDVVSMDTVEGASLNFRNATIGDLLRLQYAGDFNIMPNFSAATDAYDYGRLLYTRANPSDSFGGEFNIWSSYDFDPSDLKASDIIVGTITADTVVLGDGSTVTDGAIKYDSADNNFYGYNGTSWEQLNGGGDTGPSIVASDITTSDLTVENIYGGTIVATDITTQSLTVTSDFTTHHLDVAGTITATDLSIDIIRDVVSMDTVEGASLNFRNATIGDLLRLQYAGDFNIMPNFSAATDAYDYGRLLYTRANPSDSFGGEFNIWSSYDFDPSDLKASDIIVGTITADTVVLGDGSTVTDGAIKYDSADNNFYGYNGASWEQLNGGDDIGPSIVASDITTEDLTVTSDAIIRGDIYCEDIYCTDISAEDVTVSNILTCSGNGNIRGTYDFVVTYYDQSFDASDRILYADPFITTDTFIITDTTYQSYIVYSTDFSNPTRNIYLHVSDTSLPGANRFIQLQHYSEDIPDATAIQTTLYTYTDISNPIDSLTLNDTTSGIEHNSMLYLIDLNNLSIAQYGNENGNTLFGNIKNSGVISSIDSGYIDTASATGIGSLNLRSGYFYFKTPKYYDVPRVRYTSAGTQILLSSDHSDTSADYAIGLATNTFWHSIPTASDQFSWYAGATEIGKLDGGGNMFLDGDMTTFYSDQRLKKMTAPIDDALNKLCTLNTFEYTPNDLAKSFGFRERKNLGVSAQEVKELFPQIVRLAPFDMDQNGNSKSGEEYLTVQYERLVPVMIKAFKEVKERMDEQDGVIGKQRDEIDELKQMVQDLSKKVDDNFVK